MTTTPPLTTPGTIHARLNRLPVTRSIWIVVGLLSIGGWFEIYDLFMTAYIGPGMVKSGLFSTTTTAFFGLSGLGVFVFATFVGLFVGTIAFAQLADRCGRRNVFTWSLLVYAIATLLMAIQTTGGAVSFWRFVAGIGIGVQLVTIDTYVAELVPGHVRGRAFAFNRTINWSAIPIVALLAWRLVPLAPLGWDGWRWVVAIGAVGALLIVGFIRLGVPESPRWLAEHGRIEEADAIVSRLEAKVAADYGAPLPPPGPVIETPPEAQADFSEIWKRSYRRRTIMLMVFNFFQTIGVFGFANWVPTLLVAKGVKVTTSLFYAFTIAIANPVAPVLSMAFIDRIERKWIIVCCAATAAVAGLLFAAQQSVAAVIALGVLITLANQCMALTFHSYQSELFPTRVRARAVGFVYSMSRVSAALNGFMIPFCLRKFGVDGPFVLIAGSMVIGMAAIGIYGPRTRGLQLEEISR